MRTTIELKKELIAKHESGTRVSDLAAMFEMPKSTMCTILKNKEVIKAADVAKGVTILTSKRLKFIGEVEKLLFMRNKAWRGVSLRTMNPAWKKLWPECVTGRDFEGFEEPPVVPVIVSLGKSMRLEVSEEDVEGLVEDHKNELTTEELQHLHKMQQEEVAEEITSEEEEGASGNISIAEIKELLPVV
ncbi:hypothetical protein chiPu_0002934 [Chiloscyllium punctatum]|uniref:Uncharacterized protein n=1 Tax=Chiloscyllium punctatum TaxID=137246 RepID=A0A401S299_CHIPU|nr:hypothetical protein [Chiloscyllium punctatum]